MYTRLTLIVCSLLMVAVAGCARGPQMAYDAMSVKDPMWQDTEIVSGDTPLVTERPERGYGVGGVVGNVISTVSWGAPDVVPAELSNAPYAVADSDGPYLLDTGDKLRIFVYGQPNLSRGYTVDHAGKITVPLIGSVHARGKTTRDLQRSIRNRLGAEYVRNPQVTVDIQENRPFFILGEVTNSGAYPYVSGMTVETAVAIAGGYSERASTRSFRITRRVNGFVETIEAPADYVIRPGDTVFIHERFL